MDARFTEGQDNMAKIIVLDTHVYAVRIEQQKAARRRRLLTVYMIVVVSMVTGFLTVVMW